jgi:deoxyribonuclease V
MAAESVPPDVPTAMSFPLWNSDMLPEDISHLTFDQEPRTMHGKRVHLVHCVHSVHTTRKEGSVLTISELIQKQREMARQVILADRFGEIRCVGGCDVALRRSRRAADGAASVVVMTYPSLEVMDAASVRGRVEFPYVPGLLSFRELPLLTEAFAQLRVRPDVLILDGQGFAHPRRFGLACHAGIVLDVPTIGCAKSRLCGEFKLFALRRGKRSPLLLDGEKVGYVVCTRDAVKPVFVSPGHRVSFATAVEIIVRCAPRYRLPEPIRLAHIESHRALGE